MFFSIILIERATGKYNTTKKMFFSLILIERLTGKYYTTQNFFNIILIEMATAIVQENITQNNKTFFLALF